MNKEGNSSEKKIRFSCGAILGLFVGFGHSLLFDDFIVSIIVSLLGMIIFGILAQKYGDRFWQWVSDYYDMFIPWA